MNKIIEGIGTKESPLVNELWLTESKTIPDEVKQEGNYKPSLKNIPYSTYYSQEYADLEMEHVWKKTWQYACREEDIPNIGDRYPYDVGPLSFIIIRSGENEFKALYNTCLHRGTRLCDSQSGGHEIRCPFHGWQWNLDGSLKDVPGKWDFPQVNDEEFHLPEARVGTWGGCLFINPDPDCGPLDDALGVLKDQFKHADLGNRFTLAVTAKKMRANWKNVWAAFLESYHVAETHWDAVDFNGDWNTKYDCYDTGGAVISRTVTPAAVPSPTLEDKVTAREACILSVKSFAIAFGLEDEAVLPDFDNIPDFSRKHVAEWRRGMMKQMFGADMSYLSDAEMLDSIQYAMFPNFGPWLGEGLPLMYQFIPYGDNPEESLFVVRLLAPIPDEGPRPPSAPFTYLDFDEFFDGMNEWGRLGHIFDQDMSNIPLIQRGMRSANPDKAQLVLAQYQEQRVALMHEFVEQKIKEGQAGK